MSPAVLLAAGCGVLLDAPPAPPPTLPTDSDLDGWDDASDCDPSDPDVHPGAEDPPCDGIDSDCDGDVGDATSCTVSLASADGEWVAPPAGWLAPYSPPFWYVDGGLHTVAILDGPVVFGWGLGPDGTGAVWRLPGDGEGSGDPTTAEVIAYPPADPLFPSFSSFSGILGAIDSDGDAVADLVTRVDRLEG